MSQHTICINDWSTYILMFVAAICIFLGKIPKYRWALNNILSPLTRNPPGLASYRNGPAHISSWPRMMSAGWFGSMLPEMLLRMELPIFKDVPSSRLSFYMGNLSHIIRSLLSHFCLFQNAILLKVLKLGFLNFKPVFLRMQFSLRATFFFFLFLVR